MTTMPNSKISKHCSKPARTKPAKVRRDDLMNAAAFLFLKNGVANTAIEQITSRAQVAKGTFYLYFSSKESILEALGDRFAEQLLAGIKASVAQKPADHWKEKLAAWTAACLTGYLDSIRLHDVVFNRARSRPHTREGLIDNIIIDHLEDLLQSGTRARAWRIEDPRFTAVYLFSALHGIIDYTVAREKRPNVPHLKKRIKHLFFRAVGLAPT